MDSGTTINLFGNPKMIKDTQKMEIPTSLWTNVGSKMVGEVGQITESVQTKFHLEMIANVMSLNETTKKYQVTFNSGYENAFKVHIGDTIVNFTANDDGIYLIKLDNKFYRKLAEEKKGIRLQD